MPSRVTATALTLALGAAIALGGVQLTHAATTSTGRFEACVSTTTHELYHTLPSGGCTTGQTATSWVGQLDTSTASSVATTSASNDKAVGAGVKALKSALKTYNKDKKKYASLASRLKTQSKTADKIGSLSDMSQQLQLELQVVTDRQSKLLETISNILKKLDGTDDSLVNNLK
jgi:hypothetical protein